MKRWMVGLVVVGLLSLMVGTAEAGSGRRVVRVHRPVHVVHHVPVVRSQTVVRVVPHHHHHYHAPQVVHAPHVHHRPVYVTPVYGHAVVRSYPATRIYVGGPVISLRIGY